MIIDNRIDTTPEFDISNKIVRKNWVSLKAVNFTKHGTHIQMLVIPRKVVIYPWLRIVVQICILIMHSRVADTIRSRMTKHRMILL